MTAVIVALVIIVALAVAAAGASVRILREYERAVVFRLGRLVGAKGPGHRAARPRSSTGWCASTCARSPSRSRPRT